MLWFDGCGGEPVTIRLGQIRWAGLAVYVVRLPICADHTRILERLNGVRVRYRKDV